jgi:hypothetical protein
VLAVGEGGGVVTADPRLARLRSLDTKATRPHWWHTFSEEDECAYLFSTARSSRPFGELGQLDLAGDAALIAAMRNAWPAMITLLEGVLELHSRIHGGDECGKCWKPWPCRNAKDALAVLDTLDPP